MSSAESNSTRPYTFMLADKKPETQAEGIQVFEFTQKNFQASLLPLEATAYSKAIHKLGERDLALELLVYGACRTILKKGGFTNLQVRFVTENGKTILDTQTQLTKFVILAEQNKDIEPTLLPQYVLPLNDSDKNDVSEAPRRMINAYKLEELMEKGE